MRYLLTKTIVFINLNYPSSLQEKKRSNREIKIHLQAFMLLIHGHPIHSHSLSWIRGIREIARSSSHKEPWTRATSVSNHWKPWTRITTCNHGEPSIRDDVELSNHLYTRYIRERLDLELFCTFQVKVIYKWIWR